MTEVQALEQMLCELESSRLEVQLAPLNPRMRNYNEGGMKRVVVSRPPSWFSRFCQRHPSSRGYHRGFDTRIKRANVISTLRVLASGRPSTSKYAQELRKIAGSIK